MAYAMEFRLAVATAHEACGSSAEVAEAFNCSESWVRRLMQRERATGSLEPKPPRRPDTSKLDEADLDKLRALITQKPDMTLAELAAALDDKVSVPTVLRARRKLGFTRKKSPSTPPSRTVPT
jgi:transposase